MKTQTALLCLLFSGQSALGNNDSLTITSLKSLRPMNGINPALHDKFWEKWQLVTTRYRGDNGEQRYIYANDLAYSAMRDGELEFPDGAMFGKVAFLTEEDPQFPNSFEAIDFTRLQLMEKDRKRFKETDGWGYWLHVDGVTSNSAEDSSNALACHACHTLVKQRDFVFSGPTFLGSVASTLGNVGTKFEDRFRTRALSELNQYEKSILALLPQQPTKVKSLRMRLFSGSLHESIGPLARFTESKELYLLSDPIQKRFLLAQHLPSQDGCKSRAKVIMIRSKKQLVAGERKRLKVLSTGTVCDGSNRWVKSTTVPSSLL